MTRLSKLSIGHSPGPGGRHILVACFPKSGSTFLTDILANLPTFANIPLVHAYGRREQELDVLSCARAHHLNYVSQHHVRYSDATDGILKTFNIFPIILTRSIFDCVISYSDHLHRESLVIPPAYLTHHILSQSKCEQFDAIIDLVVPWYVSFVGSWSSYEGEGLRTSYEEMTADPKGVVSRIADRIGFDVSPSAIDAAIDKASAMRTRLNVGKSGRGMEMLSDRQIERIRKLFSYLSDLRDFEHVLGQAGHTSDRQSLA